MSEQTKGLRNKSRITFIISLLLNIVPMIIFVMIGFVRGDVQQKLTLGFTASAALLLGGFMLMSKANLKRSIFWVLALGMVACLEQLYPMFITMGACTLIDELIVAPLHKRYNEDYHTNKQIDKRLEV